MSVHDQRVDEIAAGLSTATRAEAESMAHELAAFRGRDSRIAAAAPEMLEALQAIMRRGELANISADPFGNYGGKKPPTKDVFAFPRHMLTKVEAAIAKATGEAS